MIVMAGFYSNFVGLPTGPKKNKSDFRLSGLDGIGSRCDTWHFDNEISDWIEAVPR